MCGLLNAIFENVLGGLVDGVHHVIKPASKFQNILSVDGGQECLVKGAGDVVDNPISQFLSILDFLDLGFNIFEVVHKVLESARHILDVDRALMQ
jgi:hypothetical protein